jgi:SAM-dependent methyltransferase
MRTGWVEGAVERARDRRSQRALERQLAYQRVKAASIRERQSLRGYSLVRAQWAYEVRARLEAVRPIDPDARALEVGSGAHGLVFFFGLKNGVGVDPLADEYAKLFPEWQRNARTVNAFGEALPFEDASFDLVLSDNCVDHARDPRAILREIARVLAPGGLFYFTVHIHHPVYAVVSRLHGAWNAVGVPFEIQPFADHTVHLTLTEARALFDGLPFRILREVTDIAQTKADARRTPPRNTLDRLKRVFFKNATIEVIAERT